MRLSFGAWTTPPDLTCSWSPVRAAWAGRSPAGSAVDAWSSSPTRARPSSSRQPTSSASRATRSTRFAPTCRPPARSPRSLLRPNDLGRLRSVVHTAGVSPVQATPEQIVAIDVIGTARVLDEFEPYVQPGTVAVCIASMAGSMTDLPSDVLRRLAATPTDELASLTELDPGSMVPGVAYGLAKRANQVRVEAASVIWGRRGGRVVSISPGIIATPMGAAELSGPFGDCHARHDRDVGVREARHAGRHRGRGRVPGEPGGLLHHGHRPARRRRCRRRGAHAAPSGST